jgi:hypothetical protein
MVENKPKEFKCHTCFDPYPLTEEFFYRVPSNTTGFAVHCKTCQQSYFADHRHAYQDRKKRKEAISEGLSDFELACLTRKLNPNEPKLSIYKEAF